MRVPEQNTRATQAFYQQIPWQNEPHRNARMKLREKKQANRRQNPITPEANYET